MIDAQSMPGYEGESLMPSGKAAKIVACLRTALAAAEKRAEEAEGLLRDLEGRVEPALWKRIDAALTREGGGE